jgi:hypothetical protein
MIYSVQRVPERPSSAAQILRANQAWRCLKTTYLQYNEVNAQQPSNYPGKQGKRVRGETEGKAYSGIPKQLRALGGGP